MYCAYPVLFACLEWSDAFVSGATGGGYGASGACVRLGENW